MLLRFLNLNYFLSLSAGASLASAAGAATAVPSAAGAATATPTVNAPGTYTLKIEQYMRQDPLAGILTMGLTIEKPEAQQP